MPKTTYVWDELSDNVIEEYEDGVLSASYTHEPGLYGNLLSQNRNGVTSYYHYDGRGDTVALTDDADNVTDTKEYDAWGNVIASTGGTVTPYQFGGRHGYQTGNTGVYVRARMYQPTVARWTSLDSLRRFSRINTFEYVSNSPILSTDTTGIGKVDTNPESPSSISPDDYRRLAHSTDECHADPDNDCICLSPQDGCEFFIFVNIKPPSVLAPILKNSNKTFSFDLTLEAHPGPRKDLRKPIDNSTCFGDFGRSPILSSITVIREFGDRTQSKCVLTKEMFTDPGGTPIEEKLPFSCKGLLSVKPLISRIPPSTLGINGIRYVFSGGIISAKLDFEIETFCGCGVDPENLGRPGGAVKKPGRLKVNASIP